MRKSIINAVFHKELMELLRNRRSLLVLFGVPLLLYPALTIAVASLSESKQSQLAHRIDTVAVVGADSVPKLMDFLTLPDSKIQATRESAEKANADLRAAAVDAIITASLNYEDNAITGYDAELNVKVDSSRTTTPSVQNRINKVLNDYHEWIFKQRLANLGVPSVLAIEPKHSTTDIATSGQSFGVFLALSLPLLLLLTGMLGALYPALSATTTERELGTLETLLVTPATRGEILTAKAGIVLISGLLTALLNMISMSLVISRVLSQAKGSSAGVSIDPRALALSYLAAVPTLIFFTSLVLMAGLLARNLREANAYATPLMMVPIASGLIGFADPAVSPGLLVTPVANTTIIIREVLTGHAHPGEFALAFISSMLYAGLVLSLAGRLFTNEQLVNPAWEPLSLRFLRRGAARKARRPRWPAVDEVLALFAVSLLLSFYIAPTWIKYGLPPLEFGVETLLIAGPAFLFAWLGNYEWRAVFSFRKPTWQAMLGAALLGVGLIPVLNDLSYLQNLLHFLPRDATDAETLRQLFEPPLRSHPFLAPIVIGLLAGVCEELLYRGPIQAALTRRLPIAIALIIGGLLFAAAHMDLSGLPIRAILGILLGWIVWRTGSIFPAMLLHAVFDSVSTGWDAHQLAVKSEAEFFGLAFLAGGIVLSAAGWMLLQRRDSSV